jgi:hypothetical protein
VNKEEWAKEEEVHVKEMGEHLNVFVQDVVILKHMKEVFLV